MGVATYEGSVRNGRIQLASGARLPEGRTVYVVVPEHSVEEQGPMRSPTSRLAVAADAGDFTMETGEEPGAFIR